MNTRTQTDIWIYRIALVLGLVAAMSILGAVVMAVIAVPRMEFFGVLGVVSLAGLARLLASPLNRSFFD